MRTITLTIDNLGEASELERGRWDGSAPLGRHPSVTVALPRLLDELARHRLRATFCVEAINCELNPAAVREIDRRGHELAAHGWRHEPWAELAPGREPELLRRARTAFDGLGVAVTGFRPPGGGLTAEDPARLVESGFRWCSPEHDAIPRAAPSGEAGIAWLPFRWEDVDAYHLMDRFAALRASRGDPRAPNSPAQTGDRLREALRTPGQARTFVLHPFLMLDAGWWEQVQAFLGDLAALRDGGTVQELTAGDAAAAKLPAPAQDAER